MEYFKIFYNYRKAICGSLHGLQISNLSKLFDFAIKTVKGFTVRLGQTVEVKRQTETGWKA